MATKNGTGRLRTRRTADQQADLDVKRNARANALGLLYDADLADILHIEVSTLKNRRARGELPPSSKIGREHVTTIDDLKRWLAQRKH